jgi:hypothetical protein
MADYTLLGRHFNTVHIDKLFSTTVGDKRYVYINRQSDEKNAHGHERYKPLLAEAHARLSPDESFKPHFFTGSGCVGILLDAFNSGDVGVRLAGTYFEELRNALQNNLPNIPGRKLCVVFPSIDRIFRPLGYDPRGGASTWNYTDGDFAIFQRFLDHFFDARVADIQFVVIDDATPSQNRSNATRLGQSHTGRRGGRPRQIPSPKKEALRLAREHGWNAGRIRRHLLRHKIQQSIRTIQLWLAGVGLESEPGRPKKEENNAQS